MLNINLKRFKFLHKKKQNQIIFSSIETTGEKEILNLIDNFLIDKNSFRSGQVQLLIYWLDHYIP